MPKNNASQELKSWLAKSKLKVDGIGVDFKPSIPENLREKKKFIEFLGSENGNLDAILSSYKSKRKELQLNEKIGNEMNADENVKLIDDKDTAPLNNKTIKITGKERMKKSDFEDFRSIYSSNTLENLETIKNTQRSWNVPSLVNSSSVFHCMPPINDLELKSNKRGGGGDKCGGRGQPVEGGGIERE